MLYKIRPRKAMIMRLTPVFAALFIAAAAFLFPAQVKAQAPAPEVLLRAPLVLTTSDVYTTFTAPGAGSGYTYVDLPTSFTLGSLDSAYIWPVYGFDTTDVAATGWYDCDISTSIPLTANERAVHRVPLSTFGGAQYIGFKVKGTGTVTNSLLGIGRRYSRR